MDKEISQDKPIEIDLEKAIYVAEKRTTLPERLTYGIYFIGQNLVYFLVTNFLLSFYTDYVLLPAIAIPILMLVSKVWDAINDPIFGFVVDKIKFKKGKFLPWIIISSILIPVTTILVFSLSPNMSPTFKIIAAFVTYLMWDLAYTISDIPIFALTTVMTDNTKERSTLITYGRFFAMFGIFFIMLAGPVLVENLGFFAFALIVGIAALVFMLPIYFTAQERFVIEDDPNEVKEEEKLKDIFVYLRQNKYLTIIFGAIILIDICRVTLTNYIATNMFGGLSFAGLMALAAMPTMILTYIVVPLALKKFDKIKIFRVSVYMTIVCSIAVQLVGYSNPKNYLIAVAISSFPMGIRGLLMFTFAADCIEYGNYKLGVRKEGVTFSIQTFTAKFTAGVATAVTALVLVLIGYDGALALENTLQPQSVIDSMWLASNLMPIIGCVLSIPLLLKYHLTDRDVQIMADINTGELSREEGEKLLSRQY